MRIFELTREAVAPPKPLPILPQGVQTPPPLTDKDVAPKPSSLSGKNPQLQTPAAAPAPAAAATPAAAKPALAAPAAAPKNMSGMPGYDEAGNPLNAVGSAPKNISKVNPPSKSGVVSKADLEDYRVKSGNPTATLGQYMNQQQGLTARKGGANDPAVIAARRQPVGPAVGSQAQTAGGKNELAKQNIAGLAASQVAQPPAAEPTTSNLPTSFGQSARQNSGYTGGVGDAPNDPVVVSRNDGVPPPEPAATVPGQRPGGIAFNQDAGATAAPAAAANPMPDKPAMSGYSNSGGNKGGAGPSYAGQGGDQTTAAAAPAAAPTNASGYNNPGGVGNVADFGVRGTPILPYGQGSPVKGTTNAVTRTDAEIGDKGVPGSFDKNRAQGEKNLNALKGLFGGNKQPTAPAAVPAASTAAPLRGQFAESTGMQDPVLIRMQNLAGIRR